jgi:hypothetical protein
MSLVHFVERPAIRACFNRVHVRPGLACAEADLDGRQPVRPLSTRYMLTGTAFDYLARFKTAHVLGTRCGSGAVDVIDGVWIAERSVEAMRNRPEFAERYGTCRRRLDNVRRAVDAYVGGDASRLREAATGAQWLAHIDALHRTGELRNPDARLDARVHEELLALADAFEPERLFAGARRILLNPTYEAAARVDGADPDLVVDDGIVDIKTTTKLRVDPAHLRQLAGYAAMQRLGGIRLPDGKLHDAPATWIGIYFARHGLLQRWRLEDVLPGRAFEQFCTAFEREMDALAVKAA